MSHPWTTASILRSNSNDKHFKLIHFTLTTESSPLTIDNNGWARGKIQLKYHWKEIIMGGNKTELQKKERKIAEMQSRQCSPLPNRIASPWGLPFSPRWHCGILRTYVIAEFIDFDGSHVGELLLNWLQLLRAIQGRQEESLPALLQVVCHQHILVGKLKMWMEIVEWKVSK